MLLNRHFGQRLNPGKIVSSRTIATSADTLPRKKFARVSKQDLQHFESILGQPNVKTWDLEEYNVDWMKWFKGDSTCVLTPENEDQISQILKHCFRRNLAIVPQAGNTGLVGGSVPVFDEIVLSTRKLNKHYSLDSVAGVLECDAGFILEELDTRLQAHNYMMPIDLGAKGSCLIGGNIATNAGGIRLIRYGSLQANVLALHVVIPDEQGTILRLGSSLRKDNADLHLKNLFVGSEGQLGVITKVALLVAPRPASVHSAFLGATSFQNCCKILGQAKLMLNEVLSSFELMDSATMECIQENTGMKSVLAAARPAAFNLLVETSGSNAQHDSEKMEKFLEHCLESGLAVDGILAAPKVRITYRNVLQAEGAPKLYAYNIAPLVMSLFVHMVAHDLDINADSVAKANYLWKLRENASLALNTDGYVYKHDFSLPLTHFYTLAEVVRQRLGNKAKRVVAFGHVGDGNIHLNVTTKSFDQQVYDLLYPFIYDWVVEHGGSISAEHGIGRTKRLEHNRFTSPKKLAINAHIKQIFDPRGILSPYKRCG